MATIATQNGINGLSVAFSAPVNMKLMSWSNVLIPDESRPDETAKYNNFNFNVNIWEPSDKASISFGVRRSNNTDSMYKATYSPSTESWTLAEITFP